MTRLQVDISANAAAIAAGIRGQYVSREQLRQALEDAP
jgi:hypothetical protein